MDFIWNGQTDHPNIPNSGPSDDTTLNPYQGVTQGTDDHFGRLAEIRVIRMDGSTEVVTQKARYLYFDDIKDTQSPDDASYLLGQQYNGSAGDLCQVVVSKLVDDDHGQASDSFYERVWQYRYYDGNHNSITLAGDPTTGTDADAIGFSGDLHQLLAVFYPEQIEFYADHFGQESSQSFGSAEEAAESLMWVSFEDEPGVSSTWYQPSGANNGNWEQFFEPNDHFQRLFDVASKVISYYEDAEGHRIKTQLVNAGDASSASCGCSGTTGGARLGKRFDYLYKRFEWGTKPSGIPTYDSRFLVPQSDGYSCQIVESYVTDTAAGTPFVLGYKPYRVHAHDYYWPSNLDVGDISESGQSGVAWKVATVLAEANQSWSYLEPDTNPMVASPSESTGTGKRWVTMYEYGSDDIQPGTGNTFNAFHKRSAKLSPAAVNWDEYVPAVDEAGDTESVELPTQKSTGLVVEYAYDKSWRESEDATDGTSANTVSPTLSTFGATRPDLITKVQRFPVDSPTGDEPTETIDTTYGYHNASISSSDPNGLIVAWKKIAVTSETKGQNGPNTQTTYINYEMYDEKGQLRWTQDSDGMLTYYEYDSATGVMTKVVLDADENGSYVASDADLPSDFPDLSTSGWSAPGASSHEELVQSYTVDLLGRVTSTTDASGNTRYTRYEVRDTDNVESDGSLSDRGVYFFTQVNLPYKLSGGASFDGPITITWMDAGRQAIRTSNFLGNTAATYDPPNGDLAISATEVSRRDTERLLSGLPARERVWHNVGDDDTVTITGRTHLNKGSYVTDYVYDTIGRLSKLIDPEGGVTQHGDSLNVAYDVLDRPISVLQGTLSDTPVLISKTYYDSDQSTDQGVGNGNVTLKVDYADASDTRETKMWYDYRNRMIAQQNPLAPHSVYEYDDLGRVVKQATFTDGIYSSGTTLYTPDDYGASRSTYSETMYNNRGIVFRTKTAIDPTVQTTKFLETNTWYDNDGRVIATWAPNSPAVKYEYDKLDRPSTVYQTDRYGDLLPYDGSYTYADIASVTDDHVISQTEYSYVEAGDPGAGQPVRVTMRMRHHDHPETASGDGALTTSDSVSMYTGYVYDDAGRQTHTLNYGTNDSSGFVSITSVPAIAYNTTRSTSAALIQSVEFDEWGRVEKTLDPAGKITQTVHDDMSRTIATIESQSGIDESDIGPNSGGDNWEVSWTGSPPADQDRVTTFWYDGLSNVTKRTAHINGGGAQVTKYVYGTTRVVSSPGTMDSLIGTSGLLEKIHYPNESTGAADTSAAYTVSLAYNRLGEVKGKSDQNGTVHKITRDDLGRTTSDLVDALGSGVDGSVMEITASFDNHGRIETIESENVSNTVLNAVEFEYTKLHQVSRLWQDEAGAVNTSTSPSVEYVYSNEDPITSGENYSRLTGIRYPAQAGGSTNTIDVGYAGPTNFGVINDRISRVSGYGASSWGHTIADSLVSYRHIGQGMPAIVNYDSIDVGLDSVRGYDGSSNAGQYPGFDQYGRRIWHAWVHDGFTTGTTGQPDRAPLMARRYDYDKMSNRTFDWDGRPGAVAADRDWGYDYDQLDRLEEATRGLRNSETSPSSIGTIAAESKKWNLDMLGNGDNVITDLDNDQLFETGNETEDRDHNSANEMDSREGPVGSGITFSPTYDAAGNFKDNNPNSGSTLEYKYDAWNRLVKVEKVLPSTARAIILENTYNGLNWRVTREVDTSKSAYDGVDEKRIYYYSKDWQMVEEHVDTDLDDDTDYVSQQIWGERYIDDAVAKRIDRNNDDVWTDANSEYFYLTDAMFSVRALMNDSGFIQERIDYTPYGVAVHRYGADFNEDGYTNGTDSGIYSTNYNAGTSLVPGDIGYDPDVDLNGDGQVDSLDGTAFAALYDVGFVGDVPGGWLTDVTDTDWTDNSVGYDGYLFDWAGASDATTSGLYCVRNRSYDPAMGRWLHRDKAGYVDGSSLYEYVRSNSLVLLDPFGKEAEFRPILTGGPSLASVSHAPRDSRSTTLVFPNSHGTLTESLQTISLAFASDSSLAVATGARFDWTRTIVQDFSGDSRTSSGSKTFGPMFNSLNIRCDSDGNGGAVPVPVDFTNSPEYTDSFSPGFSVGGFTGSSGVGIAQSWGYIGNNGVLTIYVNHGSAYNQSSSVNIGKVTGLIPGVPSLPIQISSSFSLVSQGSVNTWSWACVCD